MVRIRFRQRCAMSASTGHASLEGLHPAPPPRLAASLMAGIS
jgi:hypothetical protein